MGNNLIGRKCNVYSGKHKKIIEYGGELIIPDIVLEYTGEIVSYKEADGFWYWTDRVNVLDKYGNIKTHYIDEIKIIFDKK